LIYLFPKGPFAWLALPVLSAYLIASISSSVAGFLSLLPSVRTISLTVFRRLPHRGWCPLSLSRFEFSPANPIRSWYLLHAVFFFCFDTAWAIRPSMRPLSWRSDGMRSFTYSCCGSELTAVFTHIPVLIRLSPRIIISTRPVRVGAARRAPFPRMSPFPLWDFRLQNPVIGPWSLKSTWSAAACFWQVCLIGVRLVVFLSLAPDCSSSCDV